jgi:FixJ family two-component response regulator
MPPYKKLIAVVEDNECVRKGLERLVRTAGYRCEGFANAEDLVAIARTCKADCVISDINLRGMSGLQLAVHPVITELKIPVVLITGSIDPKIEDSAREVGAAFLFKPILGQELLEAIIDTAGPPITDCDP